MSNYKAACKINDKLFQHAIPKRPRSGEFDITKLRLQKQSLKRRHRSLNTAAHASLPKINNDKEQNRTGPDNGKAVRPELPPVYREGQSASQRSF